MGRGPYHKDIPPSPDFEWKTLEGTKIQSRLRRGERAEMEKQCLESRRRSRAAWYLGNRGWMGYARRLSAGLRQLLT